MSLFNFLKRKKEKPKEETGEKDIFKKLEELCGDDKELCDELIYSLLLNPTYFGKFSKELIAEAEKFEKAGNKAEARIIYECAGGLALYEKNPRNTQLAFKSVARLSSEGAYASIRKNPEKAIEIVTKIYQDELKPIEEKK